MESYWPAAQAGRAPRRAAGRRTTLVLTMALLAPFVMAGCVTFGAAKSRSSGWDPRMVRFNVSPDGKHLVFMGRGRGDAPDLYLLNLANRSVRRVTNSSEAEQSPAFSPDGRRLVFVVPAGPWPAPAHLFACALDGSQRTQITHGTGIYDADPSFSPDGSQIVFMRAARKRLYSMGGWTWDDWDVFVVGADGRNLRQVTREAYYKAGSPCLDSAQGGRVLFHATTASNTWGSNLSDAIYAVNLVGKANRPKPITPLAGANRSVEPALSRDGKSVAFISDRATEYRYEVWRMNADGSKPVQVTRMAWGNTDPAFSPDKRHIYFLAGSRVLADSGRGVSGSELWRVDADGKNRIRLADNRLWNDPLHRKPAP